VLSAIATKFSRVLRYYVCTVAEFFIPMLVSLPVLVLWFLAVPLIVRPFGVRLPWGRFGFRERDGSLQRLTSTQYVWIVGVLYWGFGMLIVTTLGDYIDWKYWNGSSHDLSTGRLLFHAVLWPLSGLLFGWLSWKH
jgi:hypothetical protein